MAGLKNMRLHWGFLVLLTSLLPGNVFGGCPFGNGTFLINQPNSALCLAYTRPASFQQAVDTCFRGLDKRSFPLLFPSSLNDRNILTEIGVNEIWLPVGLPYEDASFYVHNIPSDPRYNLPANISIFQKNVKPKVDCLTFNIKKKLYQQRFCRFDDNRGALCGTRKDQIRYVVGPVCPPGEIAIPAHKACFSVRRMGDLSKTIVKYIAFPEPPLPSCDTALIRDHRFNTDGFLHLLSNYQKGSPTRHDACLFSQTSPPQIAKLHITLHYNRTTDILSVEMINSERMLNISCYTDAGRQPHSVPVAVRRISSGRAKLTPSGDGYYWCMSWDVLADSIITSDRFLLLRSPVDESPDAVMIQAPPSMTPKELSLALGVSYDTLQVKRKLVKGFLVHLQPPMMGSNPNVTVVYVRNTRVCRSIVWHEHIFPVTPIGGKVVLEVHGGNISRSCVGDYNEGGYWTSMDFSSGRINFVHYLVRKEFTYGKGEKTQMRNMYVVLALSFVVFLVI